jgi:short-subunit dehydrogenase
VRVSQAFAPVLKANGGGALLNVLSIASWINSPLLAVYGATKSAAWALTNGLRHELREQKTQVLALHVGFIDTDLVRGLDMPKTRPTWWHNAAYDALAAGADECWPTTSPSRSSKACRPPPASTRSRCSAERHPPSEPP